MCVRAYAYACLQAQPRAHVHIERARMQARMREHLHRYEHCGQQLELKDLPLHDVALPVNRGYECMP